MPVGPYETFDACVIDQKSKGHDDESARAICGEIEKKTQDGRAASLPLHGLVRVDFRAQGSDALELDLYDSIGSDPLFGGGISAKQVFDTLAANSKAKKILVRLNSAGGIVTEGLAIYNLLKTSKAEVTCRVDGLAGSIASIIAMAGRLEMPSSAMLMIHNPWGWVEGESGDLRHQADVLDSMREMMLDIYCAKSGRSRDLIGSLMDEEKWMSGTEAVAYGLADSLIPEPKAKLAAHFDLSRYKNTPRSIDVNRSEFNPKVTVPSDGDPIVSASVSEALAAIQAEAISAPTLNEPPQAAETTPEKAAESPAAPEATAMDEQVYKDKIAELEATVVALKAELDGAKSAVAKAEADAAEAKAKSKSKDKGDDDDDDDDDEMNKAKNAVVARVQAITGHNEIAGLVGALEVHLTTLTATQKTRTVEARVKALKDSGKITPAQARAFKSFTHADLDVFEAKIGDARVVAIGSEHQPDDTHEAVVEARAAVAPRTDANAKFDPEKITLSATERQTCKVMSPLNTAEFEKKFLADKRERARVEWEKSHGQAA